VSEWGFMAKTSAQSLLMGSVLSSSLSCIHIKAEHRGEAKFFPNANTKLNQPEIETEKLKLTINRNRYVSQPPSLPLINFTTFNDE
jgi:hypothetical protein